MESTQTITMASDAQAQISQIGSKNDVSMGGFIHLAPKTHDISLASQHIPDIAQLGKDLNDAVQAAWHHRHGIRYKKVEALLLRWADDDLGVLTELQDLERVLVDLYFFSVQKYDIPSEKPDNALTRRVLDFLDQDGEETLFILYYAGHGRSGSHYDEGPLWYANRSARSPYLPARGIQSKFEEAFADTLLLYDCCNSAASTTSPSCRGHKGVTEDMAACGYEAIAAEVGEHSFSNALIQVLALASKELPMSVAEIHARVLSRLKCWSPSLIKDGEGQFKEDQSGRLARECLNRKTPIYGILCETVPRRSIVLGPLKTPSTQMNTNGSSTSTSSPVPSNGATLYKNYFSAKTNPRKRKFSETDMSQEPKMSAPQILLAIRLDKEEIDIAAWKECLLRQLPSEAQSIKIEGIYKSFSTLLLLSVPLWVWNLLPSNTAYSFVGFITSNNLALVDTKPAALSTLACTDPSTGEFRSSSRLKTRDGSNLNTGENAEKSSEMAQVVPSIGPTEVVKVEDNMGSPTAGTGHQSGVDLSRLTSSSHSPKYHEKNLVLSKYTNAKQNESQEQISSTITNLSNTTKARDSHKEFATPPRPRSRAQKPKVKTGCITCRARRVKCDESKPHCLRCRKFGRLCDGYTSGTQRGLSRLQPRIPSSSIYGPSVSFDVVETEEEHLYFQAFIDHFAHEIPGFFDPELWTVLIPQAAHEVSCIRHSIIALGAMYKAWEGAPGPGLKVIVMQSIDKKHHESAVRQHVRAIQSLNSHISSSASPQLRTALLASLLFIYFETMQGQYASAAQQLCGCLKIIRSYYLGPHSSRPWISASNRHNHALSNNLSKSAFRYWQSKAPLAIDRAIIRYGEEYFDSCIVQPDPNTGSQQALQPGSDDTSSAQQPQEIVKLPAEKCSRLSPDPNVAAFQTLFTWLQGLDSGDHEERLFGENQGDTDDSISATSQDHVTSSLASRRPSSTFSHSSILSGGTRTTYPTMAHPNLSSMAGAPDPKGSQPPPRLETAPQSQPNPRTVPVLQNTEAIEGILLRAFMRLESNEVLNAMMPQIPPLEWDIQEIWSISIPVTPFEAIATAQLCWESLMNRALKFYRRICFNQTYCPSLQRASGEIPNQQTYFLQQLAKFHTCFKPLLDKAISSETDEVKSPIALLISVHWRHVHVLVKSLLSNSEMIYDKYIDDFAYIVKTSKQLISNHAAFATRRLGRFTLEIGVIPALHFTATKCRDPNVRRAAIALLFQDPRQEGEYDGVLCARIGRWITACEEDGLPEPPLPLSSPLLRPNVDDALPLSPPGEGWNHTMPVDNETQMDQCVLPKQTLEDHTENTSYTTWHVPEENRFVLTMIEYHIPERYLKAKIQKAVPSLDGTREERESVIAW